VTWLQHVCGLVGVGFALLAPVPLAAALAGCGRSDGPGLRVIALIGWWMALGMTMVLALGWNGTLSSPLLYGMSGVVILIGVIAWSLMAESRARISADINTAWDHWHSALAAERIALAVMTAVAVVWLVALTVVPSDNYDSHMYQLPTAAEWLQHGWMARSEQWRHAPSYERSMFHYPGAWNAWYALVLGMGGHERWVFVPNMLPWALYAAAVRSLARQAGATSSAATLAAALAVSVPVAGFALASAHNDLALAAVWLASIVSAITAARNRESSWLALTVLLVGMAIGIKPNGVAAGACALAAYVVVRWHHRRHAPLMTASWWQAGGWLLGATLLAALIALPWYIRNALETGNPLGFLQFSVLGHDFLGTIDAAYIAKTTLEQNFHATDIHHWGWLGASVGVYLGLAWLGLLAPLGCWRQWHRGILGLLILTAVLGWAWIAGPWSAKHAHDDTLSFWMGQQLRYTFTVWGVVAALAAAVAGPSLWRERAQVLLLWGSVLATTWISTMRPAAPWLMALITVVFAVMILRGRRPWRRGLIALVVASLAIVPWVLRDWRQGVRNYWYFGAPSALARLDDRPIVFWATHQAWLLYGDQVQRRPIYLPLDTAQSDAELAAMVRDSGCEHLAIGETWPPTPPMILDRLIALGVVEPVHLEAHDWGMKILRILR